MVVQGREPCRLCSMASAISRINRQWEGRRLLVVTCVTVMEEEV